MLAAIVVHMTIRLDEFTPADIERYDTTLRAPETIGTVTARTGHCAGWKHCGLVADDSRYLGAASARPFEVDLFAAHFGIVECV